jgi:hypothetical protein
MSAVGQTYELNWSGPVSNLFYAIAMLFFVLVFGLCLRTILRSCFGKSVGSTHRGFWQWVGLILFFWLGLFWIAVNSALVGAKAAGDGVLEGYAASTSKATPSRWLAISIIGALAVGWGLVEWGLCEPPLQVSIFPARIELLYRFPIRNKVIKAVDIESVHLERHKYLDEGGGDEHWYGLVIVNNGQRTVLRGSHRPWYEAQMKSAFDAIQQMLANTRGKLTPNK